jgi:hypothetical protein
MVLRLSLVELAVQVAVVVQTTTTQLVQVAVQEHQDKETLVVVVDNISTLAQAVVVAQVVQVLKVLVNMYRVLVVQELHQA